MQKSETIGNLAKSLAAFQSQMKAVEKNAVNPFFKSKYTDLAGIWDAIREPLAKNGLSVTQIPNEHLLTTMLMHVSGEWLCGNQLLSPKNPDPQSIGSAITYARRYGLSSILGIVTDEDDDGNGASNKTPAKPEIVKSAPPISDDVAKKKQALEIAKSRATPAMTELSEQDRAAMQADRRKQLFDALRKRGVEEELFEVVWIAMQGKTMKDLGSVIEEVRKKISV